MGEGGPRPGEGCLWPPHPTPWRCSDGHQRQGLALGFEAGDDLFGVHPQLDDLQRHSPLHRFILLGHINHAAAAFTDLLEQFVAANAVASPFADRREDLQGMRSHRRRRFFQESAGGVGIEQRLHAMAQGSITTTGLIEAGGALLRRQRKCGSKNGFFVFRCIHVPVT